MLGYCYNAGGLAFFNDPVVQAPQFRRDRVPGEAPATAQEFERP
jgi:hypothetical protein